MPKMVFDSVHLTQFKGVMDATYNLYDKTDAIGANGVGKSTLGLSLVLPFTGKDLSGKANPEIRPDFLNESEPHIDIMADIDGKPIQIEMFQKDTRSKKDIAEGKPAKISNKYRINGVDKTATSFKAELESRGIDLSKYEMLTSPEYFMNLKEADKRSMVFCLASDITDMDVVNALGEEAELIKQKLENYTLVEIESLAKRDKKAASERLDSIPEQIIGLQKAIPDVSNLDELQAEKGKAVTRLAEVESEIAELKSEMPSSEKIVAECKSIERQKEELVRQANADWKQKNVEAKMIESQAKAEYSRLSDDYAMCESRLSNTQSNIRLLQTEVDEMLTEYKQLKEVTFPEGKAKCPACGQTLPKDRIDSIREKWQSEQDFLVKNMRESGNRKAAELKRAEESAKEESGKLEELKVALEKAKSAHEDAKAELNKILLIKAVSESEIPECVELDNQIAELKNRFTQIDEYKSKLNTLDGARIGLKANIENIDKQLGKQEVVERIKSQISTLEEEKRSTAQALADAENILYQIGLISRKKNEMLSDSVNSHFSENIRFKLYDIQKNGELKDVCVPLVKNEQGEWKEVGRTANASLELMAKIAILDGFQRFYNLSLPIICDNSESMDAHTKSLIKTDCQLIFLTVKDDVPLTVTELK